MKDNILYIPYFGSDEIWIGVCQFEFLDSCSELLFTKDIINSTFFNLTIDSSSTYFLTNTTTFTSAVDLFTITNVTPIPTN